MAIEIETECGATIWRGFFGKNARGDHDECHEVIREALEGTFREARDVYGFRTPDGQVPEEDDEFHICYSVRCSACGSLLEWPQLWRLA